MGGDRGLLMKRESKALFHIQSNPSERIGCMSKPGDPWDGTFRDTVKTLCGKRVSIGYAYPKRGRSARRNWCRRCLEMQVGSGRK